MGENRVGLSMNITFIIIIIFLELPYKCLSKPKKKNYITILMVKKNYINHFTRVLHMFRTYDFIKMKKPNTK